MQPQNNTFLTNLLTFQQDGEAAISEPKNWDEEPLLKVRTKIDDTIEDLATNMIKDNGRNQTARWHFFIGSPGNGKSESIGYLYRLLGEANCDIRNIENDEPYLPYELRVHEEGNNYPSALIVQDASNVRDPQASKPDPAKDLIESAEKAWKRGISLIVCANRGILEKAVRENSNRDGEPWFKILLEVFKDNKSDLERIQPFGGGDKEVFNNVSYDWDYLDSRSLILNENIFNQLITKATEEDNWSICKECSYALRCPFKGNRDWLLNDSSRENFLKIIMRAEALSGQVIVFREALALIALILAGCSDDYTSRSPCNWVRAQNQKNNLFALASRRIYMLCFAASSPYGLEKNSVLYEKQKEALKLIPLASSDVDEDVLKYVTSAPHPSISLGLKRFTDKNGILSEIAPNNEGLPREFTSMWDSEEYDPEKIEAIIEDLFTEIERDCIEYWKVLSERISNNNSDDPAEQYWALRRWSSNFLLSLGALYEGRTRWQEKLDEYLRVLTIVLKEKSERNSEERGVVIQSEEYLNDLLKAITNNAAVVELSDNVRISGEWIKNAIKIKIQGPKSENLSIALVFGSKNTSSSRGNRVDYEAGMLDAMTYIWSKAHTEESLNKNCIPMDTLISIMDRRIIAVNKPQNHYATEEDVIITIETYTNQEFRGYRHEDNNIDWQVSS